MTRLTSLATRVVQQRPRHYFIARVGTNVVALILIVLLGMLMTHSPAWTVSEMKILEAVSRAHTAPVDAVALGINVLSIRRATLR